MFTDAALWMLVAVQGIGARLQRQEGQTLAEYSMIITLIAVGVVVLAVVVFRDALTGAFNSVIPCLNGTC